MGATLMKELGEPICYHSKLFHWAILNLRTYDNEIYDLVQDVKKWTHYLMGKDTIIHIDS
jgi:hypothetical protein